MPYVAVTAHLTIAPIIDPTTDSTITPTGVPVSLSPTEDLIMMLLKIRLCLNQYINHRIHQQVNY